MRRSTGQEHAGDAGSEEPPAPFIRPPGALRDEAEFLAACERCQACVEACPYEGVIQKFGPAHGQREGAPYLIPQEHPCRWCVDLPCANACPTEALQIPPARDGETPPAPIAEATLNRDTCLNSQGTICDTCAMMCPSHIKAIKMINRFPRFDAGQCTGCGMCAFYCESLPGSIAIVASPR